MRSVHLINTLKAIYNLHFIKKTIVVSKQIIKHE